MIKYIFILLWIANYLWTGPKSMSSFIVCRMVNDFNSVADRKLFFPKIS